MNNYRPSFLNSIPPIVKNLLAINVIMWLVTIVLPGFSGRWGVRIDLTDILGMHYWGASKFNVAQLFTYMFMHGGLEHLFFNMFGLYMFGGVLENRLGPKRFLLYYIISGVGAAIVQQLFWTIEVQSYVSQFSNAIAIDPANAAHYILLKQNELNPLITVGASGSIFGIMLAFGWLFPEARMMLLFVPYPIKARIFVLGYAVFELFFGVARFAGDSIAHFAHLGGMLFGALVLWYWKKKRIL